MQTSLENTKVTNIAAAIPYNLTVRLRVPLPDDVPLTLTTQVLSWITMLVRLLMLKACVERRQIDQNYF